MGPPDMAGGEMGPATMLTIREINDGKAKDGDNVKITGVVISPKVWADAENLDCLFYIFIAQPEDSPTLRDGLRVTYRKRVGMADMNTTDSNCRRAMEEPPFFKDIKMGDKVEVTGRFDVSMSGLRRMVVVGMTGIRTLGPSMEMVKPVPVADPKMFVRGMGMTPPAFRDAQAALVRFANVKITMSNMNFPFDFIVTTMDGMVGPTFDTSYLWTLDPQTGRGTYTPPAAGKEYASITGIVHPSFAGKIWVRTDMDLVPK
jgi:hypothetical protein